MIILFVIVGKPAPKSGTLGNNRRSSPPIKGAALAPLMSSNPIAPIVPPQGVAKRPLAPPLAPKLEPTVSTASDSITDPSTSLQGMFVQSIIF